MVVGNFSIFEGRCPEYQSCRAHWIAASKSNYRGRNLQVQEQLPWHESRIYTYTFSTPGCTMYHSNMYLSLLGVTKYPHLTRIKEYSGYWGE